MSQLTSKKIIQNKRAHHEYFIEKEIESGIELLGWEVKSARAKMVTIENSYISCHNKELYIYNSIFQLNTIQLANPIYNTNRLRKLLLKKHEILSLTEKINCQHYTIIILDLFWKNSWIKAHIGLAKGKKKYDKRNIINTQKWKHEKEKIERYINK